ncbi:MAG TPA: MBL fold metallo-hydrolase [Pseudonocardiaceae bacterium]
MSLRIDRVEGDVMKVNSFVVHGPTGAVVVDGMLTVSDAAKVRRAVQETGLPLAGVVLTHPHPDHYAGLARILGDDEVPIVATEAVDEVIRRDDAVKDQIVSPMMGPQWPTVRPFPTVTVADDAEVELGGLVLRARSLGPGESFADTLWLLDDDTVFAGDIAYHGMHAYLADGRWPQWLAVLDQLEGELPATVALHVGHGPPGGLDLLAAQRRYLQAFEAAIERHPDGDHAPVVAAMRAELPTEDLLFLLELSVEPALAAVRGR